VLPATSGRGPEVAQDWASIERQAFVQAVRSHRGSRRELARKLGISERTLYRRLREAKLD
ncbi:helix-turn-helix domain-containing protein, partial [Arthrospira platensis SPKY1]|nr:helix-turn-helix domain-containing protein [Arthrospira platensis SPKY1]